jgi:hypothetical protein
MPKNIKLRVEKGLKLSQSELKHITIVLGDDENIHKEYDKICEEYETRVAKKDAYNDRIDELHELICKKQQLTCEEYETRIDEKKAYTDRIDVLYLGFLRLIDAYPPQGAIDLIKARAKHQFAIKMSLIGSDIDSNQKVLYDYNQLLIEQIRELWAKQSGSKDYKEKLSKSEATEMLNKAEQYQAMVDGRKDFATISSFVLDDENTYYIVQQDLNVNPVTDAFTAEIKSIRAQINSLKATWFCNLNSDERAFLLAHESAEEARSFLGDLISSLAKIGDKPKLNQAQQTYLAAISSPDSRAQLENLEKFEKALTEICRDKSKQEQFVKIKAEQHSKPPIWFEPLDAYEKALILNAVDNQKPVTEIFSFLPSKLRTLPLLANLAKHKAWVFDKNFKPVLNLKDRLRFSHIAARDTQGFEQAVQELHVDRNLAKASDILKEVRAKQYAEKYGIECKSLDMGVFTNISPGMMVDLVGKPDSGLFSMLEKAADRLKEKDNKIKPLTINHPLNWAVLSGYTGSDDKSCSTLQERTKQRFGHEEITRLMRGVVESNKLNADDLSVHHYINALEERFRGLLAYDLPLFNFEQFEFKTEDSICLHESQMKQMAKLVVNAYQDIVKSQETDKNLGTSLKRIPKFNTATIPAIDGLDLNLVKRLLQHYTEVLVANKEEAAELKSEDMEHLIANELQYLMASNGASSNLKSALGAFEKQHYDLITAFHNYSAALSVGGFSIYASEQIKRELFLSSYEHILIELLDGISSGSCVSGKDRKAIELMHTDAAHIYHFFTGAWPKLSDTGKARELYVKIYATLYISWHQHTHADQNAPGSLGLKTPWMYLPYDIQQEIVDRTYKKVLEDDETRATNNEPKNIRSSANAYENLRAKLKALDADQVEKVTILVKHIVVADKFWKGKVGHYFTYFTGDKPKIVTRLDGLLKASDSRKVDLYDSLFNIVEYAESHYEKRESYRVYDTEVLYGAIRLLGNSINPSTDCKRAIFALDIMKSQVDEKPNPLTKKASTLDENTCRKVINLTKAYFNENGCGKKNVSTVLKNLYKEFAKEADGREAMKKLFDIVLLESVETRFMAKEVAEFYSSLYSLLTEDIKKNSLKLLSEYARYLPSEHHDALVCI